MPSRGEGATSGFVDMLGSRLGGFTEPRESPRRSGMCWIPGSIRDGGTVGIPDSGALSGVMSGAGPPPPSGNWAGGSTSAATANTGRRVRIATVTSRGTFTGHLQVGSERGTLPHRCFGNYQGLHRVVVQFGITGRTSTCQFSHTTRQSALHIAPRSGSLRSGKS
jgi:hypothetical protein